MKPKEIQQVVYTPFDRLRYILSDTLTEDERIAISNVTRRHHYLRQTNPEPSLLKPLIDIAALSGLSTEIINKALRAMLLKTHEENLPCWKWPLSIWEKLLSQHRLSGPLIAAFAYHLGPIRQPLNLPRCRQSILYACAIYGHDIVHFELNRCYLQVPAGKTSKAFVKPVAAVVKQYVDLWLKERPSEQAALSDERTGEKVHYLFQFRGKVVGHSMLNETVIPMLCARVNIPLSDSKGKITSHRGRASAVTALASVPQGMTLHELMAWCGHKDPSSTLHYIRIRPTQLAASFMKADKISHIISVLIDHDSQAMTENGPALYYDLGNLYCTNPFWSSCPHRMACIGCDFSLPKNSDRGQALESKISIHRYLEEVPLTPDEKAIAEGDIDKLNAFIKKIDDHAD